MRALTLTLTLTLTHTLITEMVKASNDLRARARAAPPRPCAPVHGGTRVARARHVRMPSHGTGAARAHTGELDLRFCAMGPEGAAALAAALKVNTSVESLLLLCNSLKDAGGEALLEMLPHNASLREIGLQDNKFSEAMKSKLKACARKHGIAVKL